MWLNLLVFAGVIPRVRTVSPDGRRGGTAVRLRLRWSWRINRNKHNFSLSVYYPHCVFSAASSVLQPQSEFQQLQRRYSLLTEHWVTARLIITQNTAVVSSERLLGFLKAPPSLLEWFSAGQTSAWGVGPCGRPGQGGAHRWGIPRLGWRRFSSRSRFDKDKQNKTLILQCLYS